MTRSMHFRRALYCLAVALPLLFALPDAVCAQSDNLKALSNGYRAAAGAGDMTKAAELARRAAEAAREELGDAHRFTAAQFLNLATILERLSEQEEAGEAYATGSRMLAAALGPEHPDVAQARRSHARFLDSQGRMREALEVLKRAHADLGDSLPPDHPLAVSLAADLARSLRGLGHLDEAEPLYERVLESLSRRLGGQHPRVAGALNNLALVKRQRGDLESAERLLLRAVDILRQQRGPQHPSTATALDSLGGVRLARGHFRDALADLQGAQAVFRTLYPDGHPRLAQSLNNVAVALLKLGRVSEAETIQAEQMAMTEQLFGPDHPAMATAMANMGAIAKRLARFDEAADHLHDALEIRETALGPLHPQTIATLNNLAVLYQEQARYDDAEDLLRQALARGEQSFAQHHPGRATVLHNMGNLLRVLGRDAAAEDLLQRALDIRERSLGPRHSDTADSMEAMGALRQAQGRFSEAEPYFLRALEIREAVLGTTHPDLANGLRNLAALLALSGRLQDGRALLVRAQRIYETALGDDHPAVASVLAALADFDRRLNLPSLAVASLEKALGMRIDSFDALHPEVALTMEDLGGAYLAQGETEKALEQFRTAHAVFAAAFGSKHRRTAQSLNNIAGAEAILERYDEAERHYREALAIQAEVLGSDHPDLATTWGNLAALHHRAGEPERALAAIEMATDILEQRLLGPATDVLEGRQSERKSRRDTFLFQTDLALQVADAAVDIEKRAELIGSAFRAAQLAQASKAARAIARTASRIAAGDDEQAQLVRERQDLATYLSRLQDAFLNALNTPDADARQGTREALRSEIFATRRKLADADRRLEKRFPRYQELTNPHPLSLADARALLRSDEGLLVLAVDRAKTYIWAVHRGGFSAHVATMGDNDLADLVAELRDGVDLSSGADLKHLPRFDTRLAYDLYEALIQPGLATLAGKRHVYVVADGPLSGLPLGLLVTQPQQAPPLKASDYLAVPWLAMEVATTVLPTIASLRAVRTFEVRAHGPRPFLGIGDPVLEGGGEDNRGLVRGIYRNGGRLADVGRVRQLARLPDTRTELTAIASSLGAPADDLLLGPEANEARLRGIDMSRYRVVSFATHGLVAGELQGLPEPALVLTPPEEASVENDGLLTASEITGLSLNAELVILSACNTAAGDRPDGEGFSGLASAFVYAGGRALMASHWPVASGATQALTRHMFDDTAADDDSGPAEKLRRAMLILMRDQSHPEYAHPAFWAPFVILGRGGPEY